MKKFATILAFFLFVGAPALAQDNDFTRPIGASVRKGNGPPVGVPAGASSPNLAQEYWDATNNKLYVYSNGWRAADVGAPTSRTISTTSPLAGGGDLSADRTITFISDVANKVLATATSGGSAVPTLRALVAADIPSLPASQITTGQLVLARGGLGVDASTGIAQNAVFAAPSGSSGAGSFRALVAADIPTGLTLTTAAQPNITSLGTLTGLTMGEAANVALGTTTGTKIGTATSQKLGFFNATPVVQESGSNDVLASLVTLGLRAASSNPPLNLGSGALTAGNITGTLQTAAQANVTSLGTLTGLTVNTTIQGVDGSAGTALTARGGNGSAGVGGLLSLIGGAGAGIGTNRNAGGVVLDTGASNGSGTGQLLFKVPAPANGSGSNATSTALTIDPSGFVYAGLQNATVVGNVSITASPSGLTSGAAGNASLNGGAGGPGDTNKNAGGVTLSTGLPTGTGTADFLVQSGFTLGSGTTTQTAYDRFRATSKTKTLSTTSNTNTVFCNMSNAVSDSAVGCTITGTIEVIDATGHHVGVIHFTVPFSCSNKNGTCSAGAVPVLGTGNGSINTDATFTSLTTTFTAVVSGTNLTMGVTPTWAAGTPTVCRLTYQVQSNGQTAISPQ